MRAKIICGAGVFDLLAEARDPGVVIAESDYQRVLNRFAGENAPITMRAKKYRTRISREKVGALVVGLLDR